MDHSLVGIELKRLHTSDQCLFIPLAERHALVLPDRGIVGVQMQHLLKGGQRLFIPFQVEEPVALVQLLLLRLVGRSGRSLEQGIAPGLCCLALSLLLVFLSLLAIA
jgi:hypothetical protein